MHSFIHYSVCPAAEIDQVLFMFITFFKFKLYNSKKKFIRSFVHPFVYTEVNLFVHNLSLSLSVSPTHSQKKKGEK